MRSSLLGPMLGAAALLAGLGCRPGVRVGAPCAASPSFAPFDAPRPSHASLAADSPDGLLDALVAWYQHHGRARSVPGVGCPFAPSCSAYARTALARYGPIAILLIVDRLIVREHEAAAAYYQAVCIRHTTRLFDDVP